MEKCCFFRPKERSLQLGKMLVCTMYHAKEVRCTAQLITFPLHPQTLLFVPASVQDSIFCGYQKKTLCIARESNPGHQNGNLVWCHYTSNACLPIVLAKHLMTRAISHCVFVSVLVYLYGDTVNCEAWVRESADYGFSSMPSSLQQLWWCVRFFSYWQYWNSHEYSGLRWKTRPEVYKSVAWTKTRILDLNSRMVLTRCLKTEL